MKETKTILLFLLLALLLPGLLIIAWAVLPSVYTESYYAELAPMFQRLQETEGKKLVVLGNSDVAFGLDGALMERLLAEKGYTYTVCPFGLYAAVGTSAMLELSKSTLHEGDLVLLVVEPVSETLSTYFGAEAFWKCAESSPGLLLGTNKSQRTALLGGFAGCLQERYAYVRDGLRPPVQGVYAKSSFNERCDMIFDRPGNIMAVGYDPAESIVLSALSVETSFAEQVSEYCAVAGKEGACVCASFSPVNRSALTDASMESVYAYFSLINSAFPCPVISDPSDYILDSGWFYDSNFHLNSAGTEVRTVRLTEDVLAYLGCYQPVHYVLPSMPNPLAKVRENTDSNAAAFSFTPIGGGEGWLISGLTEQGKAQTSLIVPAVYEGKAIVGFTGDALAEAAFLEELAVPSSVVSLPDGLFAACGRLTRLILQHTETPCGVSADSFKGADQLRVFVPAAAYSLYRDGYGCESNPWAPHLDRVFSY